MTPALTASDLETHAQKNGGWGAKNRVGVFLRFDYGTRRNFGPQVVEVALGNSGCDYETASGQGLFINRDLLEERGAWTLYNDLNETAEDPYAGASGVEGTSWDTDWEQAQDRLMQNTSMPHTTQTVTFSGKRNSGLPGSSENNQKTYSANATGHYPQGGAPGTGPLAPDMSVGNPAAGNADINLYIYAGNNPINSFDPLGLADVNLTATNDPSYRAATAIPSNQAGLTSVAFHGDSAGGLYRDIEGKQRLTTAEIVTAITNSGRPAGNQIVAYVCYSAKGENLEAFKAIAQAKNTSVVVATSVVNVEYRVNSAGAVTGYNKTTVGYLWWGKWQVIEKNDQGQLTVRDRGTPRNAARAESKATKAHDASVKAATNATAAAAKATAATTAAEQAKQNAARPEATAADKTNATKAQTAAQAAQAASNAAQEAAKKAAAEAERAAREAARLRDEANHPL